VTRRRSGEATPTLAHDRNLDSTRWVNPLWLAVAHDAWCADTDAQAVLEEAVQRRVPAHRERNQRIPTRADALAVLGRLSARANPQTIVADLTYKQLEVVTAVPARVGIPTVFSIALELGLIVNVGKAGKPITQGGAGRAPKRRLDYLVPYLERIMSDSREESTDESCREPTGIASASRPPLSNPLTNNAADEANNAGRTWASDVTHNVIGHIAGKQRSKPAQVRSQYGPRISIAVGQLEDDLSVLPPDDHDLVAYIADTIIDGKSNPATRRRLGERAEAMRVKP